MKKRRGTPHPTGEHGKEGPTRSDRISHEDYMRARNELSFHTAYENIEDNPFAMERRERFNRWGDYDKIGDVVKPDYPWTGQPDTRGTRDARYPITGSFGSPKNMNRTDYQRFQNRHSGVNRPYGQPDASGRGYMRDSFEPTEWDKINILNKNR